MCSRRPGRASAWRSRRAAAVRLRTSRFQELASGEPGFPGEVFNLPAGKADEGIAAADGVVKEGEGMIFGQGGEPEGELGEVNGHGIAVHAVEAALRDDAHGEEFLGLIVRERRGVRHACRHALHEHIAKLAAGFDEERGASRRRCRRF